MCAESAIKYQQTEPNHLFLIKLWVSGISWIRTELTDGKWLVRHKSCHCLPLVKGSAWRVNLSAIQPVVGVGRYKHIMLALRDVLNWLPVPQRIQFKIAISAFDCVREHCPAYFNNVCIPVSGRAHLRSAERHDMLVPSTRTQLGRRSFHVAAPADWNALPSHLPSISRGQFRAGLNIQPISSHRHTDNTENFCWTAYSFTFTLLMAEHFSRLLWHTILPHANEGLIFCYTTRHLCDILYLMFDLCA